jgi:hypothetical protein
VKGKVKEKGKKGRESLMQIEVQLEPLHQQKSRKELQLLLKANGEIKE